MSGEFNIFKNLDDLKKTNLLTQLKNLQSATTNSPNNSQEELNDSLDFDALLNNHSVKSPIKRQKTKKESSCTPEKTVKKKANLKPRRSSTSSERSLSPVMPLLENVTNKVDEIPVGRRTRRSLNLAKKKATASVLSPKRLSEEEEFRQLYGEPLDRKGRGRSKSRGRGGGRGRGRKSIGSTASQQDCSLEMSENVQSIPSNSSSNDVSEQESDQPTSLSIMERFLQQGRQNRNNVMRARRNYIAEVAARSTIVDSIDLVSSPWPRVEGMITLDSDTEEAPMTTRSKKKRQEEKPFTINSSRPGTSKYTTTNLDNSYEDDNPELSVKINWKGKPEAFKLRKYQKFSIIFQELAQRENTDIEKLVFNVNNRIIQPDDTPDSIDYKIFQFINGRVLANNFNSPGAATAASKKRDANKINLKIQSDKWKRPLQIDLLKTDKFRILYIKCSEELKAGIEQLKLSFDGEFLDINDTPADLDLEGGEVIDLRIKD